MITLRPPVRPLTTADLERVREVYNHAVRTSEATLDTEEKSLAEVAAWLKAHGGRYPAVGADVDGVLAGYGMLSPFADRGGYRCSAELSVYVAPEFKGLGVGATLCEWLTEHGRRSGMSTVLSLVTSTNATALNGVKLAGYQYTGVLRRVGYKFGRYLDLEVHQRFFDEDVEEPPP